MAHFCENTTPLVVQNQKITCLNNLIEQVRGFSDVCVVRLPALASNCQFNTQIDIENIVSSVATVLTDNAVLVIIGEIVDLIKIETNIPSDVRYQHWVAIKRLTPLKIDNGHLTNEHFGILIHTRYKQSLKHIKTRVRYTYCPTCDRTTKDYGGKKHTYHAEGTLLSDVWRDIACDLNGDISVIIDRLSDLFGLEPYKKLLVLDCSNWAFKRIAKNITCKNFSGNNLQASEINQILQGDCITELKKLPDNSIDFIFADPPYNLRKQYTGYGDGLDIQQYFSWCDEWIKEAARVLKPGRTFTLLNIPLWSIRHFKFAETILNFQNWIVWDALSFPVRLIMPSHYTILCFSKGHPRDLPGLTGEAGITKPSTVARVFDSLLPLKDGFCLRSDCIEKRWQKKINDRDHLTDLWTDIHRLKHNSRRVDHPCQLPPQLMYRLISLFTKQGEVVLDCFNGAGTTTLSAHQLQRNYIGIENSEEYCQVARQRHKEINEKKDPFRKEDRVLIAKNSRVTRLPKQIYKVSKKTLQLEIKKIATEIGHIPNRDEVIVLSHHPIDYFDNYFSSWGEVTAAARTTGMTDKKNGNLSINEVDGQLRLFEKIKRIKTQ